MSYILEALKKAEQQRQRTTTPTLSTTTLAVTPDKPSRGLYYSVLATLLLGAGIAIGWWHPWHAAQPAPAARPVVAPIPTSRAPEPLRTPQETITNKNKLLHTNEAASAVQPALEKAQPDISPRTHDSAVSAQPTVPDKPADTAKPAIALSKLPASIQQEMPPITVQFHAYSDTPKNRLVGINSRILHEGESVTPELKLEQITPEGVILSYKGYRIEHGIR